MNKLNHEAARSISGSVRATLKVTAGCFHLRSTFFTFKSTGRRALAQRGSEDVAEEHDRTENPTVDDKEEVLSEEQIDTTQKDEEQASVGNSADEETSASTHLSCLTVQPNRVHCGVRGDIFCIDVLLLLWILNSEFVSHIIIIFLSTF